MTKPIDTALKTALNIRSGLAAQTANFRLFDGGGDGVEEISIDKFGEVALVHLLEGSVEIDRGMNAIDWDEFGKLAEVRTIYCRTHYEDPHRSAAEQAQLLVGPERNELIVEEWGMRYKTVPVSQVNAGLFLDMRELRRRLLSSSARKRVLNLFAFTGSLGLCCLVGGAAEVTQIDVSKAVLRWAKENELLNGSDFGTRHRLIPEDALTYLERAGRRRGRTGESFDLVIVDAPSFGRSSRGTFSVTRDLPALISAAVAVCAPGGELFVTTNHVGIPAASVLDLCEAAARTAHRALAGVELLLPPQPDFRAQPEKSRSMRGAYLHFSA